MYPLCIGSYLIKSSITIPLDEQKLEDVAFSQKTRYNRCKHFAKGIIMTQKDFQGNTLNVDDIVVSTDGGYKNMVAFQIIGFTPKMIKVVRVDGKTSWGASGTGSHRAAEKPTFKSSCDVALISYKKE